MQYKQRSHGWCTTRPNNRGRHIKHSELAAILPSWYTFNFPHQMPNFSNNNILIKNPFLKSKYLDHTEVVSVFCIKIIKSYFWKLALKLNQSNFVTILSTLYAGLNQVHFKYTRKIYIRELLQYIFFSLNFCSCVQMFHKYKFTTCLKLKSQQYFNFQFNICNFIDVNSRKEIDNMKEIRWLLNIKTQDYICFHALTTTNFI